MEGSSRLKLSLILLLLFFTITHLHAQKDYRAGFIVNNSNDTLRGFAMIKGISNDLEFSFKTQPEAQPENVSPENVRAIVIEGYRYFKSIELNSVKVFAQALVDGKTSLYTHNEKFYFDKNNKIEILEIEKQELQDEKKGDIIIRKKKYIGVLKSSMADCPSIWSAIDKTRLEENGLTNVVHKYNQCVGGSSLVYKENIPKFKVSFVPVVALSYTNLKTDVSDSFYFSLGYFEKASFTNFTISPGVGIELSSPRINDRFSVCTELRYLRNEFSDRVIFPNTIYNDNDIYIKASYIFFPITFKYRIPLNSKTAINIKGGMLKTFLLDSEYSNTRRSTDSPSIPPLVDDERFDFYSSQTGLTISLGYQLKVSEKRSASIDFKFENTGPIINSTTVAFLQNVYSVAVAIAF